MFLLLLFIYLPLSITCQQENQFKTFLTHCGISWVKLVLWREGLNHYRSPEIVCVCGQSTRVFLNIAEGTLDPFA